MRPVPIATDAVAWSVCVCVSVGHIHEACNMNEQIEMLFAWVTWEGPRNP